MIPYPSQLPLQLDWNTSLLYPCFCSPLGIGLIVHGKLFFNKPFASHILCLDETRLDALGKYLKPLRGLSAHDSASFAGKLIGLLDLRAQRWLRLEWREAVHENCKVDMLDALRKDSR